jgi:hypothetical protein
MGVLEVLGMRTLEVLVMERLLLAAETERCLLGWEECLLEGAVYCLWIYIAEMKTSLSGNPIPDRILDHTC